MESNKNSKGEATGTDVTHPDAPRSLVFARRGIRTSHDFANLMAGMMSDLVEGKITPDVANATCNAGGKLLKVIEMQQRHGTKTEGSDSKTLVLA